MDIGQTWGQLSNFFDTYKDDVSAGVADNMRALWPVFLNYIKQNFPKPEGQKALEFGCGTAMFCKELNNLGFLVTGIDISEKMINVGKKHLDKKINLLVGDTKTAKDLANNTGRFNLVASMMVLQFLKEQELSELTAAIAPKGHIIFAGHNPEQLRAKGITDTFPLSESKLSVPIYLRTPNEYDKIFTDMGFSKTTENFIHSTQSTVDKTYPKYMVLGYQKN